MRNKIFFHFIRLLFLSGLVSGCKSAGPFEGSSTLNQETRISHPAYANSTASFTKPPQHIALLLPLSGQHADSAKAIRDGFLASYYQYTGEKPSLKVYDTSKGQNIQNVYVTALQEGADFVVGPLSKEEVYHLSLLPSDQLKTPILALNHHPSVKGPSHFIQYTLAPEAEAEQIAAKAWAKGYRSASVIVPDNVWGKRTASAFATKWQENGGKVLDTVYINASHDQSAAVRNLLGIDQSQKRANKIKELVGGKMEFQPRRRQDVDVIVMAAPPVQARQLKPLFDFYYAEDIPVFATSSVFSGNADPKRDRDINGITFCDMPWLIDPEQGEHLRLLLNRSNTQQSDQYNRLFAMGVDAYHLTHQFKQLQSGGRYSGATGHLMLGNNNQIYRQLSWAKMINGEPVKVN